MSETKRNKKKPTMLISSLFLLLFCFFLQSNAWVTEIIRYVHEVESTRPLRHPIGYTSPISGDSAGGARMIASGADWISPFHDMVPPGRG